MTIAIISHPECALHDMGAGHPEQPDRVRVIQAALKSYPFQHPVTFHTAQMASREQLVSAHDEHYVDWIFSQSPRSGIIQIDADTGMNPHTLNAALYAAGSVPQAVDLVMNAKANAVFCNVRPPGHHAERERAMGFCFFNNVAVGVRHALTTWQLERVAIIDFDVHHGNGTQDIFQHDKQVLYCSSFQHPFYPGYLRERDNEHILSVPLEAGLEGKEYREMIEAAWFDKIRAFQPQFIFISAGFDAHDKDPLANIHLKVEDYVWLTQRINELAKQYGEGRIVSVLEGGYHLAALAECVPAHVNVLY